jgi:PTS system N-acetylglucosamine-specific IIC component
MKFMQKLGKSLMLPVAVLPVAAILVGISNWIVAFDPANVFAAFLGAAGLAVIGNLGLLFCVGVAIGMAKNSDGTSALAGLVSWLITQAILAPADIAVLFNITAPDGSAEDFDITTSVAE